MLLANNQISRILDSNTNSEITIFRQNIASDFMKQQSVIIQKGLLCCAHLESTFSPRLETLEECMELKVKGGDRYNILRRICSTSIYNSHKSTYLDVQHKDFTNIMQNQNAFRSRFDVLLNKSMICLIII